MNYEMTNLEEIREKIAELLWSEHHREYYFDKDNAYRETDKILALVKEASYKSPTDLDYWAKANGYVKLASIKAIWKQAGDLRELDRKFRKYFEMAGGG